MLPLQIVMSYLHASRSWRAIARELSKETDPLRMAKLRQELNRALDEEAPIQVIFKESRLAPAPLGLETANHA
jgi:hypothetical protein